MSTVKHAARVAKDSTAFRRIARAGFVVLGLIHVIIGSIAISIAAGGSGDADQDGAMEQVRNNPIGGLLLLLIAAGLIALAVWQIASAFLAADPAETKKWGQRLKLFGIAGAYLVIGGLALVYAVGGHAESEEASKTLSQVVLAAPGGVALLVIVGLSVIGVGVGFVVSAIMRSFEKLLDMPTGAARGGIIALGVIGYLGKGVAVGVTGVLFVVAAVTQDPDKAAGLDAALHSLLDLPFGRLVLGAVGAGFAIYGVFCIARARFARM
ncbi:MULTISPECIES: DUF1206 domain-containing protein [Microbacterium]|jgi:hypothetical protein|uniref:DUF1206 domain-containing protein n=1 Tax=Microbacterium TaxID=33882 RepID=UPI0003027242|nr:MULTISPECIES: DUF1206 domain-containing protein [Microbacterium]AZH77555.1 DUF1206 domain-containing protein [Microbacterium sp. Y-01]MDX2399420.1 DUF1206 domain-containing protein [Microbacterium algeriense]